MPTQLKRKRPHGGGNDAPPDICSSAVVPPSRRATRQTSNAPLSVPPDPEPRRRRRRADSTDGQPPAVSTTASQHSPSPRGNKENIPFEQPQPLKPTRSTRHSAGLEAAATSIPAPFPASSRPAPRMTTTHVVRTRHNPTTAHESLVPPPADMARPRAADVEDAASVIHVRSDTPTGAGAHQQSVSVGRHKPITMATTSTTPRQHKQANGANSTSNLGVSVDQAKGSRKGTPGKDSTDRNIDKVVLGDICFRAWYPSYYGKDVLGDSSHNTNHNHSTTNGAHDDANGAGDKAQQHHHHHHHHHHHGRREPPPMLERLYVCPCCFKYSKELVSWWEHVKLCERKAFVPGRKIYTHPKGSRTIRKPSNPNGLPPKTGGPGRRSKSSTVPPMIEEVIRDQGEWSIYEVDGEVDVLFCQNLSLFAKLFLDNKSVFFDVTGFNYFLLVYTPPPPSPPPPPPPSSAPAGSPVPAPPSRPQIVGFFSKEKMSWDNNNLACILVFPPWQRKGLGALLMGISYEISRREGVLGGPEKPISDLGKKGYKRFWAGEIARWLLQLESNSEREEKDDDDDDDGEEEGEEEEVVVVDVTDCSEATWIAQEDCLCVLREMGVAEEAGPGPRLKKKRGGSDNSNISVIRKKSKEGGKDSSGGGGEEKDGEDGEGKEDLVQRVRISKTKVKEWVERNRISLERAVDPDGFVEGYAIKAEGGGSGGEAGSSEEGSP